MVAVAVGFWSCYSASRWTRGPCAPLSRGGDACLSPHSALSRTISELASISENKNFTGAQVSGADVECPPSLLSTYCVSFFHLNPVCVARALCTEPSPGPPKMSSCLSRVRTRDHTGYRIFLFLRLKVWFPLPPKNAYTNISINCYLKQVSLGVCLLSSSLLWVHGSWMCW